MRLTSLAMGLFCALAGGCAWSLDDPPPSAQPPAAAPVVAGCPIAFAAGAGGAGYSAQRLDGAVLWLFGGALNSERSDGILALPSTPEQPCDATAVLQAALPQTATSTEQATPLSTVVVDGELWGFFESWTLDATAPMGVRITGRGIARHDAALGSFVRMALLWTADRPNWGISALQQGSWVYAYGCESYGFLQRRCYVARADAHNLTRPEAWTYSTGGGQFSADPDTALPVLLDAGDLHVTPHPSGRLLATYVTPLGDTLFVRTALSPTGPFSSPKALMTCPVEDGEFCTGGIRHPWLETVSSLVLTYARGSFEAITAERRQPRLVTLPLPANLP